MKLTKRMKYKQSVGHKIIKCPICHTKTFPYCSWSEDGWGECLPCPEYCIECNKKSGHCKRCIDGYAPTYYGFCAPCEIGTFSTYDETDKKIYIFCTHCN